MFLDKKKNSSVLLISHGGWLRELMTHLSLNLKIADISSSHMQTIGRVCPNTAVSKFLIYLEDSGTVTQVECLSLHDNSHLENAIQCGELAV